jgi:arylsulfatase A-like enzyme
MGLLLRTLLAIFAVFFASVPFGMAGTRPNILLIVADDLGYSDLGSLGSEIATPILDALATEGAILTQFHAAPNCSPSRSAMLTGVDSHRAGVGGNASAIAENQIGLPAYQGYLRDDVTTISELLQDAGYHTVQAGKWHLGHDARNLPGGRGFDQSFALINGAASHWADQAPIIPGSKTVYMEDDVVVPVLPADFYSSTFYTDKTIEYIDDGLDLGKPFFAYLAYTAPHNPLHAPDAYIEKYKGVFDQGWDVIAQNRLHRQIELGLLEGGTTSSGREEWILAWDALTNDQRAQRARDMEIYAGMIDYMDYSIGRVLQHLKDAGEYDNTMIVFMSDNGPSKTAIVDYLALGGETAEFVKQFDNSLENKGRAGSSTDIGPGWAYASATPQRLFKGYVSQGGIRVPAIVKPPSMSPIANNRIDTPIHVFDLMPTFLDFADVSYPDTFHGTPLPGLHGLSLRPILSGLGDADFQTRPLGWEAYGMDALRVGDWKSLRLPLPFGNNQWQLYNLKIDPGETTDLAGEHPERLKQMASYWEAYAEKNGVVHPDQPVLYSKDPGTAKF